MKDWPNLFSDTFIRLEKLSGESSLLRDRSISGNNASISIGRLPISSTFSRRVTLSAYMQNESVNIENTLKHNLQGCRQE